MNHNKIEIPTLETERLLLRVPSFSDVDALTSMYADPLCMKYIGTGQTRSRELVEEGVTWIMEQHRAYA